VEQLFELVFKSYGIVGLIILAPLVALKYMWNHSKELQTHLQTANERVNETHSRRVEDAKEIAGKLMAMIAEHAELSKETNIALERVGDMLSVLQNTGVSNMRGGRDRTG
jgi:ubiquinone biosynthesis protein COQ9